MRERDGYGPAYAYEPYTVESRPSTRLGLTQTTQFLLRILGLAARN
ncbi:hypothetical protein QUA32_02860 [Microcoleus sp. Pol14D6]